MMERGITTSSRVLAKDFQARSYKPSDFEELALRVEAYYREDQKIVFDRTHLSATVAELGRNPNRGRIDLLELQGRVIGYAILATFWSNEFGGSIVYLDEIFIDPERRSSGLGRTYIRNLIDSPPLGAVAIQLEITPENIRARNLYESLGFQHYGNIGLIHEL